MVTNQCECFGTRESVRFEHAEIRGVQLTARGEFGFEVIHPSILPTLVVVLVVPARCLCV